MSALTISLAIAAEDAARLVVLPGMTARVEQRRVILVAPPTGREGVSLAQHQIPSHPHEGHGGGGGPGEGDVG